MERRHRRQTCTYLHLSRHVLASSLLQHVTSLQLLPLPPPKRLDVNKLLEGRLFDFLAFNLLTDKPWWEENITPSHFLGGTGTFINFCNAPDAVTAVALTSWEAYGTFKTSFFRIPKHHQTQTIKQHRDGANFTQRKENSPTRQHISPTSAWWKRAAWTANFHLPKHAFVEKHCELSKLVYYTHWNFTYHPHAQNKPSTQLSSSVGLSSQLPG